jgi:GATA zinc finger
VYNLPQWREVCESTDHQPPARRGEVRTAGHTVGKRKAKPKKSSPKKVKLSPAKPAKPVADSPTLPPPTSSKEGKVCENCWTDQSPVWRKDTKNNNLCNACGLFLMKRGIPRPVDRPETRPDRAPPEQIAQVPSPEQSSGEEQQTAPFSDTTISKSPEPVDAVRAMDVDQPIAEPISRPATPHSPPTLKRKRPASIEPNDQTDDEASEDSDFQNFDYRISNSSEYTVERCKELERIYWKTVTFNNPMYGADMPGSLFDDRTDVWNVAKLDNLLCRIGKTIPGVNSAYLYLGMWKATFSWHVEVSFLNHKPNIRTWICILSIIFTLEGQNSGTRSINAMQINSKQSCDPIFLMIIKAVLNSCDIKLSLHHHPPSLAKVSKSIDSSIMKVNLLSRFLSDIIPVIIWGTIVPRASISQRRIGWRLDGRPGNVTVLKTV